MEEVRISLPSPSVFRARHGGRRDNQCYQETSRITRCVRCELSLSAIYLCSLAHSKQLSGDMEREIIGGKTLAVVQGIDESVNNVVTVGFSSI